MTDGFVHKISIHRNRTQITMSLDETHLVTESVPGSLTILNTAGNIHLGGGGPADVATLTGARSSSTFIGCIYSLNINDDFVDFHLDSVSSSNIYNCEE